MKLGLHQSARMEQRMLQSPQMIQAMQILQLSSQDLAERVEQELIENPFLELVEPGQDAGAEASASGEDGRAPAAGNGPEVVAGEAPLDDGPGEGFERYEREWDPVRRVRDNGEADKKLEAMANTPDAPKSVAEALLDQLAFLDLDPRGRDIAEYLVYSLDPRGYLEESLEAIAAECAATEELAGTSVEEVAAVLAEIRRVIHPALGARDLKECLLLQLDATGADAPLLRALIEHHLEDITTNRLPRISKATGRSIEDVKSAIESLRHLDPAPGGEFGENTAAAITPDVQVEEQDGVFDVRLTRQRYAELRLSPTYRQLLRVIKKDRQLADFVKKRVESARWFIDAVQQRQSTLERIARCLFVRQQGFLEKGVRALKPLRMQEVADEVGVHISTVSRAVSGKYVQTPRGIFPLKYFFTGGTTKESGEVASQAAIKNRIAELVRQEDRASPLSDDQLAELLSKRDRIRIARRTVTKYRKALEIPSSSQRRAF
ncbi:MAG: RNA polymerase factor sigma-54 [Planctomycetes bacterium]|nr:RNA polymerase factor sigma-54 [Planctomycetota bacterium]